MTENDLKRYNRGVKIQNEIMFLKNDLERVEKTIECHGYKSGNANFRWNYDDNNKYFDYDITIKGNICNKILDLIVKDIKNQISQLEKEFEAL